MAEVLHFPSINPPKSQLHHAILYWDGISTLVPGDHEGYLFDSTLQAADAGIYRPISASEAWDDPWVKEVASRSIQKMWFAEAVAGCKEIGAACERMLNLDRKAKELGYRGLEDYTAALRKRYDELCERGKLKFKAAPPAPSKDEVFHERAAELRLDHHAWRLSISEEFEETWLRHDPRHESHEWSGKYGHAWEPDNQAALLAATARGLAIRARNDLDSPLLVPCTDDSREMELLLRSSRLRGDNDDHLLWHLDIGELLPNPGPDVDTATLLDFRLKYDDERRRLLNAVQRLLEDLSVKHAHPTDVLRAAERELKQALDDMKRAGKSVLKGWSRRVVSTTVAWGASYAAASVALPTAPPWLAPTAGAITGLGINLATNPIQSSWRNDQYGDFHYLYRLPSAAEAPRP
ncbi:hypothetical protein [Amycolatopsis magusensis]|uniref:hypothetical protein n=1 Tax=Amycolatopsis magusensis TaxID=882444 RepID=UPI0024A810DF|nr:hypothetical protein [Amycolatopsis magusensis]MDI5975851.1 hypothetical protein [Amycolatopsis magusensis]